jgi:hypothetical protein
VAAATVAKALETRGVATAQSNTTKIANVVSIYFIASLLHVHFAREGEDVVVAGFRKEEDVVVDCLFWLLLL